MILVVDENDVNTTIAHLTEAGETAFLLGDIRQGAAEAQVQIV